MSEDLNFVRDCLFLGNGNHEMSHSEGFDGERINFVIKNVTFLILSRQGFKCISPCLLRSVQF